MTIQKEQKVIMPARDDGGQSVNDIVKDVPQEYLEQMMLYYYTTNVKFSEHKRLDIQRVRQQHLDSREKEAHHII